MCELGMFVGVYVRK